MKKDVSVFVEDIMEGIEKIERYVEGMSKKEFLEDSRTQDAVIRRLEVMGEAVKNIPQEFRDEYPKIPWKQIAGMRDILIHGYFGVNLERIWNTLKEDVPDLKKKISEVFGGEMGLGKETRKEKGELI